MSKGPEYRSTTSRSGLNLAERIANHSFASILYACALTDWFIRTGVRAGFKEIARGYERFYRNLDFDGQLPCRPSVSSKE